MVASFDSLITQLNPSRYVQTAHMKREVELEPHAAYGLCQYSKGGESPKCPWLGCSPDRKVYDLDVVDIMVKTPLVFLEIKVVKEGKTSFDNVRYLTRDNTTNQYL